MKRLAVLISNAGTGTNLQAIINGVNSGKIKAEIIYVISDAPDAYGLIRAKNANIKTLILKKEDDITIFLKDLNVDFVCLAGWKQIIPDQMLNIFENRILNIHPGLIPDSLDGVVKNPDNSLGIWNRGKFTEAAIKNFLESKATYAGSSVNFLSKEFDFGPVLQRVFEKIQSGDTVESLYQRLKVKENEAYVKALEELCNE